MSFLREAAVKDCGRHGGRVPDDVVVVATVFLDGGHDKPIAGWMYCPACEWHASWSVDQLIPEGLELDLGEWDEGYRTGEYA